MRGAFRRRAPRTRPGPRSGPRLLLLRASRAAVVIVSLAAVPLVLLWVLADSRGERGKGRL